MVLGPLVAGSVLCVFHSFPPFFQSETLDQIIGNDNFPLGFLPAPKRPDWGGILQLATLWYFTVRYSMGV